MRDEGYDVRSAEPGSYTPDVRVAVLNLMPDTALSATERQFLRMLGGACENLSVEVEFGALDSRWRSPSAQAHIKAYYRAWEDVRDDRPHGLIITGANPSKDDMTEEPFWEALSAAIQFANHNVLSTFCSCFASHAVLQELYDAHRRKLPNKCWGVYSHALVGTSPFTEGLPARVDAPHSHVFNMDESTIISSGLRPLAVSEEVGVHLFTSEDGKRFLFTQGHPEYDDLSLFKEYKREVSRYATGERPDYPAYPDNYIPTSCHAALESFHSGLRAGNVGLEAFPEVEVVKTLKNTWRAPGFLLFRNWLRHLCEEISRAQAGFVD